MAEKRYGHSQSVSSAYPSYQGLGGGLFAVAAGGGPAQELGRAFLHALERFAGVSQALAQGVGCLALRLGGVFNPFAG